MSTEKLNIENLPVVMPGGKVEMVPKRQFCNHKAQTLTIAHKVNVTKGQISDMLDMIVAGKELDESNEPLWHDVYKELVEDINLAQQKNAALVDEKNRLAEEAKAAEDAKNGAAIALVESAKNVDVATVFSTLSDRFDLGNMDRCIAKEGTTDEDLMQALVAGEKIEEFSNWAKGDIVLELEKRGQEKAMVKLCEETGIPYKTIYKFAVTAKNVPPENRKKGVAFTTYAEIAGARFSTTEAKNQEVLAEVIAKVGEKTGDEKADAQVITTAKEARQAVKAAQGKSVTPPDPNAVDLEKHEFLVINTDDNTVSKATGFPRPLEDTDGIKIIHVKTLRSAYGAGNKLKWTALSEYKEPAPEPEPAAEPAKKGAKAAAETPAPAAANKPAAKNGKKAK